MKKLYCILILTLFSYYGWGQQSKVIVTNTTTISTIPADSLAKSNAPQLYGTIVNKSNFTSINGFTNNGVAGLSFSNGNAVLSGGAQNFTQSLDYNYITALEQWKETAYIIVGQKNSTSSGGGPGIRGSNTTAPNSILSQIDLTNSASSGKVTFYAYKTGGITYASTSSTALSFSVGDTIIVSLERDGLNFIVSASNKTTRSAEISTQYACSLAYSSDFSLPNTGKFAFFNLGGTNSLVSFTVTSNALKKQKLAVLGDSKSQGYYAFTDEGRYGKIVNKYIPTIILANNGDKTSELLSRLPEVVALKPEKAILEIGCNDITNSISFDTIKAHYSLIVNTLENSGISVYHLLPIYQTNANQTALASWIASTYSGRIVDAHSEYYNNPSTNILGPDGVHPNPFMNGKIAEAILSSGYFYYAKQPVPASGSALSSLTPNTIPYVATSSTLSSSAWTYDPSSGNLSLNSSKTGDLGLSITNNTTGAGQAVLNLISNSGTGNIFKAGTGYSTYKTISSGDLGVYNNTGNTIFLNDNTTGSIGFAAGSHSTNDLVINANGTITAPILATGGSAPTTSGTTNIVVSDANGLLSFSNNPSVGSLNIKTGFTGTSTVNLQYGAGATSNVNVVFPANKAGTVAFIQGTLNYRTDLSTNPTNTATGSKQDVYFGTDGVYIWTATNTVKRLLYDPAF